MKLKKVFTETFMLLQQIYEDNCFFRTQVYHWFSWVKSVNWLRSLLKWSFEDVSYEKVYWKSVSIIEYGSECNKMSFMKPNLMCTAGVKLLKKTTWKVVWLKWMVHDSALGPSVLFTWFNSQWLPFIPFESDGIRFYDIFVPKT